MCCTTGSVTVDWSVDRSGFVPGQDIKINGAVQNESAETVSNSSASLVMVGYVGTAILHVANKQSP